MIIGDGENLHSKDSHLLARTNLGADERAEGGKAGTHHRGGHMVRDIIWNLEGEVLVGTDVAGVATLRNGSIGVGSTVSV